MNLSKRIEALSKLADSIPHQDWEADGEYVMYDCSPETTNSGISDCRITLADCSTIDNSGIDRARFIATVCPSAVKELCAVVNRLLNENQDLRSELISLEAAFERMRENE